ncbi:MAG TPA: carbonic anhydrase, partial [Polyangiaceae bacterium]|nr:carbonic anhydrase [Polyangiaceae bacterium]
KDNAGAVALGKTHFIKLADEQAPRATVVTCADARVQANAWDDTPENDAYTVRNLGNQIAVAHGSVEYGVEHLHTPVLLVLGHTGCEAVKAAMGKLDGLEPAIQTELSGIKLPAGDPKKSERQRWADAVVANVNEQVGFAVAHFGKLLREQRVVVVGAVYDLRNDLGKGYGRLSVVNVNGNTEPKRLKAFETALASAGSDSAAAPELVNPGGASPEAALAQLIARNAKAARGEDSDAAEHDEHAADKPSPVPFAARETNLGAEPHGTREEPDKPAGAAPKGDAAPKKEPPRSVFDHKE